MWDDAFIKINTNITYDGFIVDGPLASSISLL